MTRPGSAARWCETLLAPRRTRSVGPLRPMAHSLVRGSSRNSLGCRPPRLRPPPVLGAKRLHRRAAAGVASRRRAGVAARAHLVAEQAIVLGGVRPGARVGRVGVVAVERPQAGGVVDLARAVAQPVVLVLEVVDRRAADGARLVSEALMPRSRRFPASSMTSMMVRLSFA